jgi:tetratricopeptide (TPR) repeat protein
MHTPPTPRPPAPQPPAHPVPRAAQEKAQAGEAFRRSGLYSNAVQCFSEAIAAAGAHPYPWALAHRGAARSALGALDEAIVDLDQAVHATGNHYAWAWGQKGEAHRLLAKRFLHKPIPPEFTRHIDLSIKCFDEARKQSPASSWAVAHKGATYALLYLAKLPEHDKKVGELGCKAFEEATKMNPTYAWAYVFHAYLLGLMGEFNQKARDCLAAGLLYDSSHRLIVLRGICELYSYDRPTEEKPELDNGDQAILVGWQALQQDPEDLASRYVVAKELTRTKDPSAAAATHDARCRLRYARSRINAMLSGLAIAEILADERVDPTRLAAEAEVLKDLIKEDLDGEALSLLFMDPHFKDILPKVF